MIAAVQHRKVLVLNRDAPIQRFLILMKNLARENVMGESALPLLAAIESTNFDAIVLDVRCSDLRPCAEVHGFQDIHSIKAGKLLVITAVVSGPGTLNMVERYLCKGLPQALLWLVGNPHRPPR